MAGTDAAHLMSTAWPPAGLLLRTDRVELRLPDAAELAELALSAADEPYAFDIPMFNGKDDTPAERTRRFLRYYWRGLANWEPGDWVLDLIAFVDGRPVGLQTIRGQNFAELREVSTGSWLLPAHRGRGLGSHTRAAVLELGFAGLGARYAVSRARTDNHASISVSRKFGYADDGLDHFAADGRAHPLVRLRLAADRWRAHRPAVRVDVEGLEPCLPILGIG